MVLKEIHIPAWPPHYSNAYALFQLSSFNKNDCEFPEPIYMLLGDKIRSQDSSVTLTDYFTYCLYYCVNIFCRTHLTCCSYCGVKTCSFCLDICSDSASSNHFFYFCPKRPQWLHDPDKSHNVL